jgi:luciferase family oxidoreductase group 1
MNASLASTSPRPIRIGVLDQSPIISGTSPSDAVRETIYLAQMAEDLGFHRYWLAEHHSIAALADPCPEILLARLGAATHRIRLGTGGVMLPYYSALKVAEVFRMLDALYPDRIDLGVGRAPGGDRRTAQAMANGQYLDTDNFPQQILDVLGYLSGALPDDHPFAQVKAMPSGETVPQLWVLGSSDYGGLLAAKLGLPFAFAHFISAHGGDAVARAYRARFEPSAALTAPHSAVCVFVICAATDDEAERLAASLDLRRLHMARGIDAPVPTVEEARAYPYDARELAYIESQRPRLVHGSPDTVRAKLESLREAFQADEMLVLTITGDTASRRLSYRLVAEAFELDTQTA